MKDYNNDRGSLRLIQKQGYYTDKYRGVDGWDAAKGMAEPIKCPVCGFYMYPYKNQGNAMVWACPATGCPNNPDARLKFSLTTPVINFAVNRNRLWNTFSPRQVI